MPKHTKTEPEIRIVDKRKKPDEIIVDEQDISTTSPEHVEQPEDQLQSRIRNPYANEPTHAFAECPTCRQLGVCPFPNANNINMMVPDTSKCWLKQIGRAPDNKRILMPMIISIKNRLGLLELEKHTLIKRIELLEKAMNESGNISVAVPNDFRFRRQK